ncbi:MAG: cupin domain-containing protein [Deltaproteobacteria bacterium]|nr:cupin domain-containing protein [Deltaproteobacteria bacterium]
MLHFHDNKVQEEIVDMKGAEGVTIRWLLADAQGATNFFMRRFDVSSGGRTPMHRHDYEHEVYVLSGRGRVWNAHESRWEELSQGDVVFVPPGEEHSFEASEDSSIVFLCIIPAGPASQKNR